MSTVKLASSKERIDIIDALRGFSLAGIVIVHLVENYIAAPPPEAFNEAVHQGIGDTGCRRIYRLVFEVVSSRKVLCTIFFSFWT